MTEDASIELARWLQEAGRRRAPRRPPVVPPIIEPDRSTRFAGGWLKYALLLVSGVGAVVQYCYADTMLQILRLHSVIVFVFTGSA